MSHVLTPSGLRRARQRRARTRRAGAAAVEFAISITVLLLVVFASIEFFRLHMLKHSVEHASYMSARQGMITGAKVVDVKATALQHLEILGVSNATVQVSPKTIKDDTKIIEVNIRVPVTGNTWVAPFYFSNDIRGRTRMLAERAAANMSTAIATEPMP